MGEKSVQHSSQSNQYWVLRVRIARGYLTSAQPAHVTAPPCKRYSADLFAVPHDGFKQKTVGVDFSTPTGTFRDVGLGAPLGGRPLEAAKDLEPGATY